MRRSVRPIWISLTVMVCLGGCREDFPLNSLPKVEIEVPIADVLLEKKDTMCIFRLTDTSGNILSDEKAMIRLRGNSTAEFPKRPFQITLSKKAPLLGMPEAKKWVLLANYVDKTMLRNALAFRMSEDSKLEWTPGSRFVELYYNGVHKGTYQLCEKVEVHYNRVKTAADGWLLETDARVTEKDICFRTSHMESPFRVDWPHKHITDQQKEQIRAFVMEAEETLFSDNFTHPTDGWRKYLDEASWIDWYLINEISKNCDGIFYGSCYMYLKQDRKIAMGPVWDFDIGFGNCVSMEEPCSPDDFYVRNTQWLSRLFQDSTFAENVKGRFIYYYNNRAKYYEFISRQAMELESAAQTNDNIWHTIGLPMSPYVIPYATYEEETEALTRWLEQRFEWMKNNIQ